MDYFVNKSINQSKTRAIKMPSAASRKNNNKLEGTYLPRETAEYGGGTGAARRTNKLIADFVSNRPTNI